MSGGPNSQLQLRASQVTVLWVTWRERPRATGRRRYGWSWSALVVGAAAIAASCSLGSPRAEDVDFLAEVVSADTADWRISTSNGAAFSTGGSDSTMRVGPAAFHLADGSTLEVPAGTTGGNLCSLLGWRDQPRTETCLVTGKFDDSGDVAWFAIQPFETYEGGVSQLDAEGFDGRDAIVRVGGIRLAVPIRQDATLTCSEPGDLTATPVEVPSSSAGVTLNADLEVIGVFCHYSE